jgi:PAS domain S-box-containing protein
VPLITKGEVFGSLNLTDSEPDAYNEWHKVELEQLCAQVAGAIDNARLYQLEKAFAESQRKIFENAQVGIFIVQDGKFKYANPQFENYSGCTNEELLERPSLDLVYPEDREKVRESRIKMLKGEQNQAYEYRSVRKDGQIIWIMERVASIEYEGKRASLGGYMDITEYKQEEQRRSQFINMLTHELSTPLTPILSSGKLLSEQLEPKGEVESRLAKNILNGAHTLSEHLNELLELAKGEAGLVKVNPEPLEAENLIGRLVEQYLPVFAAEKQKFHQKLAILPSFWHHRTK